MRILIDGRLLSNKPTGISRYTRELIKSYEKQFGAENVYVILDSTKIFTQYNVIHTNLKPYNLLHLIWFYFFVSKQSFDIYHSAFYSGLVLRIKNKIQIISVHDLMFYKVEGFFSNNIVVNNLAKRYYKLIVQLSLRVADLIISVSETTKLDLKNIFGFNSLVVSEGVVAVDEPSTHDVLEENTTLGLYSLSKSGFFLYVGNNKRHKNIPFLINAFLCSQTNYKLVLVGFKDVGINRHANIVNIPSVNDLELSVLYGNCKAFIFPSLYEGFGLPILEAISHQCVIFSSNQGALGEFKFKSIHFFDPKSADELIELIDHADNFRFVESDENILLSYNWEVNFSKYQNLLTRYLTCNNKYEI